MWNKTCEIRIEMRQMKYEMWEIRSEKYEMRFDKFEMKIENEKNEKYDVWQIWDMWNMGCFRDKSKDYRKITTKMWLILYTYTHLYGKYSW